MLKYILFISVCEEPVHGFVSKKEPHHTISDECFLSNWSVVCLPSSTWL